jgi:hypothetical protein
MRRSGGRLRSCRPQGKEEEAGLLLLLLLLLVSDAGLRRHAGNGDSSTASSWDTGLGCTTGSVITICVKIPGEGSRQCFGSGIQLGRPAELSPDWEPRSISGSSQAKIGPQIKGKKRSLTILFRH